MQNTAIIGLQWGDEGKGKIVDFLADKFDAVVRFQGGNNAGHTIKVDDKVFKLSLLPSGIVRQKFSVIGSGVVVDPFSLFDEIAKVEKNGISVNPQNLAIADNVSLVLSIHRQLDQVLEEKKGQNKIGTTCRGNGPAHEDKVGRRAIRPCDLFHDKILQQRIVDILLYHNALRRGLDLAEITVKELFDELDSIRNKLLKFVKPSYQIAEDLEKMSAVMFEGAQGALLDVSYGTYPFVTSSNINLGQVAIGSCLGFDRVHKTLGILKAYTTRVGSGPFPSELNDETGEYLRTQGQEVGTVTGRNRRCGWFDAVLVKHPIKLSAVKEIVLTKLDVLDRLPTIKICCGYKIDGKTYDYLPQEIALWHKIEPIYIEMQGWQCSTVGVKTLSDLPQNALNYIKKIEELCLVKVVIISTGPKREETIIVN